MSVKVNIHPNLFHLTDNKEVVEVNGKTVGECLNNLTQFYPEIKGTLFNKNGKLFTHINIYVNQESAYPQELNKPVSDGDVIQIVLMLAGG